MAEGRLPGIIEHLRAALSRQDAQGVTDAQLLARFADHRDESAFELLVWRHSKMVFGTCFRLLRDAHEAEDAFQACFLALARRAGSVARRESVGGWLHKVALRLALAGRCRRDKRLARERASAGRASVGEVADPARQAEGREALVALDREVSRLPEKYRAPFVLCCLEGRSNAEAARELGCPLKTIESRLARARRQLREGLARRGVAAPAGPLLVGGSVSALLVASTARAALMSSAGQAVAAGLISNQVVALTEGVLRAMFLTKVKAASAALLAVTLAVAGAGSALTYRPAADAPQAAKGGESKVAALIEQLGSEKFAEREQASKELAELGLAALDALRKASKSEDPERRKRAGELLKKVEIEAARIDVVTPKRVRLAYKDTPLADAVADFNKKSGYEVALRDPKDALKGRTVTLDTGGEVTFWQALSRFCEAASLSEAPTQAEARPGLGGGGAGGRGAGGAGGMGAPGMPGGMAGFGSSSGWGTGASLRQILLADGRQATRPTDDRTSARFRALDRPEPAKGELSVTLEVALEPRLRWRQLVAVKLVTATDDQGQSLQQDVSAKAAPAGRMAGGGMGGGGGRGGMPGPGGMGGGLFIQGVAVGGGVGEGVGERGRQTVVRLKSGAKESKSLKEFSGKATAEVWGEAKEVAAIADVFQAGGATAKGPDGASIRVLSATKQKDGSYALRVEVELAGGTPALASSAGDRVSLGPVSDGTSRHELTLADASGNLIAPAGMGVSVRVKATEFRLTYLPRAGQGAPAKLTLARSESVTVEIPFTLRDVRLRRPE